MPIQDQETTDSSAEQGDQDDRHLVPARREMSKWGHYIEPAVLILAIGTGLFGTSHLLVMSPVRARISSFNRITR